MIKPRFGSWGADVIRCETPEELERYLEQLQDKPWFLRRGAVAQELVPPVGFDLRLLVAGDAVVGRDQQVRGARRVEDEREPGRLLANRPSRHRRRAPSAWRPRRRSGRTSSEST